MTEQQLVAYLIAEGVSGGRIYPLRPPQSVTYPYTIYSVIEAPLSRELDGDQGKRMRYQFTSWCRTYAEAVTLKAAFRTALKAHGFMAGSPFIDRDETTDNHRLTNNDWYIIETS